MNKFESFDYLLIDKIGDFHYFKSLKTIAEYLDLPVSKVNAIYHYCKKHYTKYSSSEVYIQRLFNNTLSRQITNTTFIWDPYERNKFHLALIKKNIYYNI